MRISPDGCSYFKSKYHQEEGKELEGKKGDGVRINPSQPEKAKGLLENDDKKNDNSLGIGYLETPMNNSLEGAGKKFTGLCACQA